jgi:hypothetical protein
MTMKRADTGATVTTVTPEYSTMSLFNSDNTRFLVAHLSYFGLYDGDGNYLKDMPLDINFSSVYYVKGNQLKQYNLGTNATAVVHTFSQYSKISGHGESDISLDGNHFAFAGDGRFNFGD